LFSKISGIAKHCSGAINSAQFEISILLTIELNFSLTIFNVINIFFPSKCSTHQSGLTGSGSSRIVLPIPIILKFLSIIIAHVSFDAKSFEKSEAISCRYSLNIDTILSLLLR